MKMARQVQRGNFLFVSERRACPYRDAWRSQPRLKNVLPMRYWTFAQEESALSIRVAQPIIQCRLVSDLQFCAEELFDIDTGGFVSSFLEDALRPDFTSEKLDIHHLRDFSHNFKSDTFHKRSYNLSDNPLPGGQKQDPGRSGRESGDSDSTDRNENPQPTDYFSESGGASDGDDNRDNNDRSQNEQRESDNDADEEETIVYENGSGGSLAIWSRSDQGFPVFTDSFSLISHTPYRENIPIQETNRPDGENSSDIALNLTVISEGTMILRHPFIFDEVCMNTSVVYDDIDLNPLPLYQNHRQELVLQANNFDNEEGQTSSFALH